MRALITPRCVLEPQLAAHAQEMFAVLADPAIYEFENAPPASASWLEQRYRRLETRGPEDGSEQWLNWVIRLDTRELAGYVQASVLADGVALIAYELNSRYWRQGIGSNAVHAMMKELQSQYAVQQFIAVLKGANYRSRGLLHKLGFVAASDELSLRYRDEPEESVMVWRADGCASTG
jgi:[ribosomal protein S5]-alanine N-acetyltransferase